MFREILLTLDVIGLGMLLGGGVYESVIMNPNYRANIPQSLEQLRSFMKVKTPANFFRIISPVTMLSLLITVVVCWGSVSERWWYVTAFATLIVADLITYAFHYPRNKVLFIDPLSSDTELLRRLAREWQTGNKVRIILLVIAILSVMFGIFVIAITS